MQASPKGTYAHTADPHYKAVKEHTDLLLGLAMRQVMDSKGVTVEDVAKIMGLSKAAVRHRLYGRTDLSAAEMVALSKALDVDPRMFYEPDFAS